MVKGCVRTALIFLLGCAVPSYGEGAEGVGFRRLELSAPVGGRMDAVAFYPSREATEINTVGPYDVDARRDAPPARGPHPLVVISHGSAGSSLGHHDLATYLARRGYVVVAPTHPGDNYRDTSGLGALSTIYGRPIQISAAVTAALRDPSLSVDAKRIAFIGFSAGGQTGLILAGAKPDFQRLEAYCTGRPQDRHVCAGGGAVREDCSLSPQADPRIRAFVLMAPLSVAFSPETLRAVSAPFLLYTGDRDEELAPEENILALSRNLASPHRLRTVPGAGHFTFLAPCSDRLAREEPALCRDAPGIDRKALHLSVNAELAAFLDKELGRDAASP